MISTAKSVSKSPSISPNVDRKRTGCANNTSKSLPKWQKVVKTAAASTGPKINMQTLAKDLLQKKRDEQHKEKHKSDLKATLEILKSTTDNYEKARCENKELQEKCDTLQQDYERAEKQIKELKDDLKNWISENEEKQLKLKTQIEDNRSLTERLKSIENLKERADVENSNLSLSVGSLKKSLEQCQQDYKEKEEQLKMTEKSSTESSRMLDSNQKTMDDLQKRVDDLKRQVKDELRKNQGLEKRMEELLTLKGHYEEGEQKSDMMKAKLEEKEAILQHTRMTLKEQRETNKHLQEQVKDMEKLRIHLKESQAETITLKKLVIAKDTQVIRRSQALDLAKNTIKELEKHGKSSKIIKLVEAGGSLKATYPQGSNKDEQRAKQKEKEQATNEKTKINTRPTSTTPREQKKEPEGRHMIDINNPPYSSRSSTPSTEHCNSSRSERRISENENTTNKESDDKETDDFFDDQQEDKNPNANNNNSNKKDSASTANSEKTSLLEDILNQDDQEKLEQQNNTEKSDEKSLNNSVNHGQTQKNKTATPHNSKTKGTTPKSQPPQSYNGSFSDFRQDDVTLFRKRIRDDTLPVQRTQSGPAAGRRSHIKSKIQNKNDFNSVKDQLSVFEMDKLAMQFVHVGDRILADLSKKKDSEADLQSGVVKYIGQVDKSYDDFRMYAGIKLDDPVGNNDGSYKGKKYFSVPVGHGKFVALDNVISVLNPKTSKFENVEEAMEAHVSRLMESSKKDQVSTKRNSAKANQQKF